MGTTVWVDDNVRSQLRELQEELGTGSVNETLRVLLQRPAADARTLFALHRQAIRGILERHHLRNLVAFGSRARADASHASDLDLAAEAAPQARPLAILAAEADLEEALGLRVHLVERPNPRLDEVLRREGVAFEG